MKFEEVELSNRSNNERRQKTRGVIILTDNRPKPTPEKLSIPDFR